MTKSELIEIITAKQKHLPAKDVELALKQILEIMSDALSAGDLVLAALPTAAAGPQSQDR
jgi:integration host factor subunit beta